MGPATVCLWEAWVSSRDKYNEAKLVTYKMCTPESVAVVQS